MFRKKNKQKDAPITLDGIENVLVQGDLSTLNEEQRISYYAAVCKSLGLNPLTKPFEYLILKGRLVLYAKKDATDQLRKKYHISIIDIQHHVNESSVTVVVKGQDAEGKIDVATGVVSLRGLSGDDYANALMKAETKAKRRLTLSICGLGILDESEIETIPKASLASHLPKSKKSEEKSENDGESSHAFFSVLEKAVIDNMITDDHKDRVIEKYHTLIPSQQARYAKDVTSRIESLRPLNEDHRIH